MLLFTHLQAFRAVADKKGYSSEISVSPESNGVLMATGGQWVIVKTVTADVVFGATFQVHIYEVVLILSWKVS